MPNANASFATKAPIAPSPITPRRFPAISDPTNCFFLIQQAVVLLHPLSFRPTYAINNVT